MALLRAVYDPLRSEGPAVVPNVEARVVARDRKLDTDMSCTCMDRRITDRFLRRAIALRLTTQ